MAFLHWLTLHVKDVPEREGPPPSQSDSERRWEEQFGRSEWAPPDSLEGCEWFKGANAAQEWASLYCGTTEMLYVLLGQNELDDFLHWLREHAATINIDPSPPWFDLWDDHAPLVGGQDEED